MNKKWQYNFNENKEEIEKIEKKFNINKMLATILVNRGITTKNARKFLNPNRHDFYDPFLMPDMEKAVDRLLKAIEEKEKIIIYGDYDVDGITSITVLTSFLKDRGVEVQSYIPNRLAEGYGLNKKAIEKIINKKFTLMITVDCGITSIEEIEFAKKEGLDIIITDHHETIDVLPKAIAVVDCKRKDNKYPFRELAGCGVVFKFTQALSIKLGLEEKEFLKYLDIVAIGTISDIVPLVDENRVITKLGLMLIKCTKNVGLKAILNEINYSKIDSTAISFGVAPRINACGRMGSAKVALDLLLTKNKNEAEKIAIEIAKYNNQRQEKEKKIYEETKLVIEKECLNKKSAIIVGGIDWHSGVIGIVASKITEMYYKPSVLVCFDEENEIGKGSGRSIPGFDLHKALMKCKKSLNEFGGHSMAIGLSVKKSEFEEFKKEFLQVADKAEVSKLLPTISIDEIINIDEINNQMVQSLELLEPFGEANKMPIFAFKNLKIDSIRSLSDGKHVKLIVKSNNNYYISAVGFNLGYLVNEFKIGDRVDIAGNLEINTYKGINSIQINLKDVMKSV